MSQKNTAQTVKIKTTKEITWKDLNRVHLPLKGNDKFHKGIITLERDEGVFFYEFRGRDMAKISC